MASTTESKESLEKQWERSTWCAEHVTKVIASSTEMIQMISADVNEKNEKFCVTVHKELLCYLSPYYTAALKGSFAEAQKDTITVDLSYDQTKDLISWLYSGQIIGNSYDGLFELYIFADEKDMLAFRRSIMSKIVLYCNWNNENNYIPAYEAASYVHRLPQHSSLFCYLVDYGVHHWGPSFTETSLQQFDECGEFSREFFYEIVKGSIHKPAKCPCCQSTSCNYHEHVNGEEWKQTCNEVHENTLHDTKQPTDKYCKK